MTLVRSGLYGLYAQPVRATRTGQSGTACTACTGPPLFLEGVRTGVQAYRTGTPRKAGLYRMISIGRAYRP